jgi:hypothetical protein
MPERVQKRAKSDGNTKLGGTSAQKEETPSGSGVEKPKGPEKEEPKRPQKQAPRVQSAIYASHKMSCSFDISHTINFTLIGMWFDF